MVSYCEANGGCGILYKSSLLDFGYVLEYLVGEQTTAIEFRRRYEMLLRHVHGRIAQPKAFLVYLADCKVFDLTNTDDKNFMPFTMGM